MFRENKSPKLLKRNKFKLYYRLALWSFFVISFFYGIIFWLNHDFFLIKEVEIVGNKFVQTEEIQKNFEQQTADKKFFLISRKNFLFLPIDEVEKEIEKNYSIESAIISIKSLNSIKIEIIEYSPVANYCQDKHCYFVNKNGRLFIEEPEFHVEDLVSLSRPKFVVSSTTEDMIKKEATSDLLGQQYVEPEVFQNLLKFSKLLDVENIKINNIKTDDFETFSLRAIGDINFIVEGEDDPEENFENFKAVLGQESIHKIQFNNIDYFDLRFEDKVFYKLK